MALTLPKLALDKKQLPAIVGGVVVLAAAAWFGWQYFAGNAAPPLARKPRAVSVVKPHAPVNAAAPAETGQARDQLIGEVLVASGLKQELDRLPARLAAGVNQYDKKRMKAPPALVKRIEDALATSFTAEGFNSRVTASLQKNFDQQRLQALLREFSTPAGKAMVELERASHSPEEVAEFARSAAATQAAPGRAALIKRIDAATGAGDTAVDVAFASMQALAMGIVGERKGKTGAVDRAIESERAGSFAKIRDTTLLNLALTFKDASDADLAKYAAICEAENSKWFYGLVHAALVEEARADSSRAGDLISELKLKPAKTLAATHAGQKSGADARACLALATDSAIIKCAEAYR